MEKDLVVDVVGYQLNYVLRAKCFFATYQKKMVLNV